jgi:hypothetical protein
MSAIQYLQENVTICFLCFFASIDKYILFIESSIQPIMATKDSVFLLLVLWQAIALTHEMCIDREKPKPEYPQTSSVFVSKEWLWDTNNVAVSFMNGDCNQRSMVRKVASEWTPYSNINFIFIDQPDKGDIRVSFNADGSWSHLGMHSKRHAGSSMNLEDARRSTILHEFGRE